VEVYHDTHRRARRDGRRGCVHAVAACKSCSVASPTRASLSAPPWGLCFAHAGKLCTGVRHPRKRQMENDERKWRLPLIPVLRAWVELRGWKWMAARRMGRTVAAGVTALVGRSSGKMCMQSDAVMA
jgi:hypothetical protein